MKYCPDIDQSSGEQRGKQTVKYATVKNSHDSGHSELKR